MSATGHNLNIESYTLDELLGLFDIKSYDISMEDLKRAKKRVLMLHPDKSRLGPEYFLFYKKAFDIVVRFYENQNKQSQQITEDTVKYKPMNSQNKGTTEQVSKTIEQMSKTDFHNKFNELFEANEMAKRPDPKRNEWFQKQSADYDAPAGVSAKNMGEFFDTVKQKSAALTRYRGVETLVSASSGAGNIYDDDGDDANDVYVTSDPFSKLKFDDLRKVHKDQTVFAVSESDFNKMPKYNSVDHYNRERSKHNYDPMAKAEAQRILEEKEKMTRDLMMKKEYQAIQQARMYEEKNKSILSTFLQIKN
jgi:hypothetical protein